MSEQWRGDFQLTADSTALTIQPGSSATSTITVTPQDGFNGNVSLTCSVSSDLVGVTCAVPATPVNASGTTIVTISAGNTSRTVPLLQRFPKLPPVSRRLPFVVFVPATLLASLLAFRRQRASHTRLAYACSSAVLVAIALGSVSCGAGSSPRRNACGNNNRGRNRHWHGNRYRNGNRHGDNWYGNRYGNNGTTAFGIGLHVTECPSRNRLQRRLHRQRGYRPVQPIPSMPTLFSP